MTFDAPDSPARLPAVEWPTVALFAVILSSWLGLVVWHDALPPWLWLPLAAWTGAWWGSAQHEALHGHPTRSRVVNTALATPPLTLWLPFECYRRAHLQHHHDERLTDPLDDPESRYWTPTGWKELGPVGRVLVDVQATLLGRLVFGPVWAIGHFWVQEAGKIAAGDRRTLRIWAWHALWVGLLAGFVFGVAGVPAWQYLLGFVYGATSLSLVRSYAEHKARHGVEHRTAVVEDAPVLGLLFLYNNLHVVHHRWPSLPWYAIPAVYRARRKDILEANGGLVYRGYADVFRRFLLARHDEPVHPLGRAPARPEAPGGQVFGHTQS